MLAQVPVDFKTRGTLASFSVVLHYQKYLTRVENILTMLL